jgi:hypothetical protein
MVKTTLVRPDISFGSDILDLLDRNKFPVSVALWLKERDSDEWNLLLGTSLYDRQGQKGAYLRLLAALSSEGRGPIALSDYPIILKGNRDPLIRGLRKLFANAALVEGMRLGGHTIGGNWIPDAYVYRIH